MTQALSVLCKIHANVCNRVFGTDQNLCFEEYAPG